METRPLKWDDFSGDAKITHQTQPCSVYSDSRNEYVRRRIVVYYIAKVAPVETSKLLMVALQ